MSVIDWWSRFDLSLKLNEHLQAVITVSFDGKYWQEKNKAHFFSFTAPSGINSESVLYDQSSQVMWHRLPAN